jgi:hypothetical protein
MRRFRSRLLCRTLRRWVLPLRRWVLVPATLGVLAAAGCSDDDDVDPAPTQTTMSGNVASGATERGTLGVTIQSGTLAGPLVTRARPGTLVRPAGTVVVAAAGTMDFEGGGALIALAGSYNTDTDSLFLSGSGYTLRGSRTSTAAGESIEGTFTGPNGNGVFFVLTGAGGALQHYCGLYTSTAQAESGVFAVTIRGSSVTGFTISDSDDDTIRFHGTATGTGTVRDVEIEDPGDPGGAPLAMGTWDTSLDTMTGSYTFGSDTGTWEVDRCD